MKKAILFSALLLAIEVAPVRAMVFWNLDNTANQADPGTGAPWGSVARVVNSDGSSLSGSAIYLGDGYLLTANHVTMDLTFSFITFDNTEFFSIDPTFNDGSRAYGKQVAAGVDMAVFKLTSIPTNATAAILMATANEKFGATNSATLIGWGVGRDGASPLATNHVTWGGAATSAKRWGVNAPRASFTVSYSAGTNNYTNKSIVTYAGNTNSTNPSERGLGDAEASATLYDSGSGLFQEVGGEWRLIGLTTAVGTDGSANYGDDSTNGGDGNYFVRISSYEQKITALVPEPPTILLLAAAFSLGAMAVLWRRRRN